MTGKKNPASLLLRTRRKEVVLLEDIIYDKSVAVQEVVDFCPPGTEDRFRLYSTSLRSVVLRMLDSTEDVTGIAALIATRFMQLDRFRKYSRFALVRAGIRYVRYVHSGKITGNFESFLRRKSKVYGRDPASYLVPLRAELIERAVTDARASCGKW